MYYSASNRGFYINSDNIPDAVIVSDERHAELLQDQQNGKIIVPDEQGNPISIDLPMPTIEQQRAWLNCTAWQFRKALNQLGWRQLVEDLMASENVSQDIKDGWEYSTKFERLNSDVLAIGTALNKSETDLDQLFQLAITL